MRTKIIRSIGTLAVALAASLAGADQAWAHCDGMDGPVVMAGERALETGDVRHALVWVLPGAEAEVTRAFDHAMEVRGLSDEARALADRFFFETLVRVHREGEGEPYTGLKPAGRDLGPAIPAADRALASGSLAELETILIEQLRHGLHERFEPAHAAREFAGADVEAGRHFVEAYVPFVHLVEAVYAATAGEGEEH